MLGFPPGQQSIYGMGGLTGSPYGNYGGIGGLFGGGYGTPAGQTQSNGWEKFIQILQQAADIFETLIQSPVGFDNAGGIVGSQGITGNGYFGSVAGETKGSNWASPLGPGAKYGNQKWSGGNGLDLFTRRGAPIYAIFSGTVRPNSSNPGPGGIVPALTLQGDNGISADYVHVVMTRQGRVNAGDRIGYVGDNTLDILGPYAGMPDAFQHLDLRLGHGSGGFAVQGGDINVLQFLRQIGYRGTNVGGTTRGPGINAQGMGPSGQGFGGIGSGGYGLLGFGGGLLPAGEMPPGDSGYSVGALENDSDTGDAAEMIAEVSASIVNTPKMLEALFTPTEESGIELAREEFQPTPVGNVFESADWPNVIKYIVGIGVVSIGITLLEDFDKKWAWTAAFGLVASIILVKPQRGVEIASVIDELIQRLLTESFTGGWSGGGSGGVSGGSGGGSTGFDGGTIPTGTNTSLISLARQQLGKQYIFGANGPNAFDCSGLVQWVYDQFGVRLNRTAAEQYAQGTSIARNALEPGDVVFFKDTYQPGISHNGIYLGNNQFLHAADESSGVITSQLAGYWTQHYAGARRY